MFVTIGLGLHMAVIGCISDGQVDCRGEQEESFASPYFNTSFIFKQIQALF